MSGRSKVRSHLLPWLLALVCLSIAGAACASDASPAPRDDSFLTGDPCQAPCWYGLELNRSDPEDVRSTLRTLPFVDATSIITRPTGWYDSQDAILIEYKCVGQPEATCGGVLVSEGIIVRLSLPVQVPITLRDAVDRLGQPDFVSAGPPAVSGNCLVEHYLLGVRSN